MREDMTMAQAFTGRTQASIFMQAATPARIDSWAGGEKGTDMSGVDQRSRAAGDR